MVRGGGWWRCANAHAGNVCHSEACKLVDGDGSSARGGGDGPVLQMAMLLGVQELVCSADGAVLAGVSAHCIFENEKRDVVPLSCVQPPSLRLSSSFGTRASKKQPLRERCSRTIRGTGAGVRPF